MAVLGMGRLGSREMTATSDLDLVALYDFDPARDESDGPRPLHATVYYGRLTNRLISALTVPTRRGMLYAVDMRLRPSGNKGPAATQYRGFLDYHTHGEAETWEHLALVRARPVAGAPDFVDEVSAELKHIIMRPRDPKKVAHDAAEMRALIAQEKGGAKPWDLKLARGGLMDIEFIAQTLVLTESSTYPTLALQNTTAILIAAREVGVMDDADTSILLETYSLLRDLMQWQRAMLSEDFAIQTAGRSLLKRLATIAGLPDFKVLDLHLREVQKKVHHLFEKKLVI
jgi:glutamate-ammonia-ligase adenylyltransferase